MNGPDLLDRSLLQLCALFDAVCTWVILPSSSPEQECRCILATAVPVADGPVLHSRTVEWERAREMYLRAANTGRPVSLPAKLMQPLLPAMLPGLGSHELDSMAQVLGNPEEPMQEPLVGLTCSAKGDAAQDWELFSYLMDVLATRWRQCGHVQERLAVDVGTGIEPSRETFRNLFVHSSIALWHVDISRLNRECETLRQQEISDLDAYFSAERRLRRRFVRLIRFHAVNAAGLELFEADNLTELLNHFGRAMPEAIKDFSRMVIDSLLGGQRHFSLEIRGRTLRGRNKWLAVTIDVLPESNGNEALVSVNDVTEAKEVALHQAESLERYRLLMETANDAILIADGAAGQIYEVNRRAMELFGRSEEALLGTRVEELLAPEEKGSFQHHYRRKLSGEQDVAALDSFIVDEATGQNIPVSIGISVASQAGHDSVQISFHDMSNRYRLEERRRLLATAVDQSAESVVITDPDGHIVYVNPAFEEVSGYSFTEVIGKNPRILNSGHASSLRFRHMWKEITAGKVWRGNFVNRKKDGTLFEEEATITPVRGRSGQIKYFVAVKRDITQQKQLEGQVRQSQKMQAIGTLAGGVAHDFNNILTAILGYAELSMIRTGQDDLLKGNIQEIIIAAERASKLIDQILTFSRQTEKSVSALQLSLIIKEVLNLLRASLPANIDIIHELTSKVMVRADPTQMHQVILNLCTNAYQALNNRENGQIRVVLDEEYLGPRQAMSVGNLSAGNYARIMVEDNGCGMAPDFLPRIFEPYFTTKAKLEGTGLGLSVVHGIVNDHGGAIQVESAPGQGSCFSVYLPAVEEDEEAADFGADEIPYGTGIVMIVDDEQPITEYVTQVLTHAGYEVHAFSSSLRALDAFRSGSVRYDLVITDMGMPELTGLQLSREIRNVAPAIPIMVCTGFSEEVTPENYTNHGLDGFISKPFTAEHLIREVHRVLTVRVMQER